MCVDEDGDEVCSDLDCDDESAERSPDLEEMCGDDVDSGCDENVDEGCVDAMPPPPADAEVDAAMEDAGAPDAVTVVVIPADGSSDAESGCSCSVDGGSRSDLIPGITLASDRWSLTGELLRRMSGGGPGMRAVHKPRRVCPSEMSITGRWTRRLMRRFR